MFNDSTLPLPSPCPPPVSSLHTPPDSPDLVTMPALPPIPSTQSRIALINRPKAAISPDITSGKGTFLLEKSAPVDKDLAKGECLVRTEWVSLDPAMRGMLHFSSSALANVSPS
jgi:hypothetical protein